LFDAIIGDLFPGIAPNPTQDKALEDAIATCILEKNLQLEPGFINKVIELNSTF
jgi:hypothetical protein